MRIEIMKAKFPPINHKIDDANVKEEAYSPPIEASL